MPPACVLRLHGAKDKLLRCRWHAELPVWHSRPCGAHSCLFVLDAQVHGEEDAAPAAVPTGKRGGERSRRGARLAAAVGVSQMVLPFWSGATWDKQHGVDVERKR